MQGLELLLVVVEDDSPETKSIAKDLVRLFLLIILFININICLFPRDF